MVLLFLAWQTGHIMAPITEILDFRGERWGGVKEFEFSFRCVELEMPGDVSWRWPVYRRVRQRGLAGREGEDRTVNGIKAAQSSKTRAAKGHGSHVIKYTLVSVTMLDPSKSSL